LQCAVRDSRSAITGVDAATTPIGRAEATGGVTRGYAVAGFVGAAEAAKALIRGFRRSYSDSLCSHAYSFLCLTTASWPFAALFYNSQQPNKLGLKRRSTVVTRKKL
jgi:hypothetical protein